MKPDDKHPEYAGNQDVWRTCRDAAKGQRGIRAGGERYLPKLSGQTDEQYRAYLHRGLFYNATGRTIEAMVGLVFSKAPQVETPGADDWQKDITLGGQSLNGFAQAVLKEVVTVGRAGILVDHPAPIQKDAGAAVLQSEAEQLALRPFLKLYMAEAVLNWSVQRIGNVMKLAEVFLGEVAEDGEDQIRQLTLGTGVYTQQVWRQSKDPATGVKGEWIVFGDPIMPVSNGKPLKEIPFYFAAPNESGPAVQASPIEDLAHINISHFQNSADLENGAHVSGLPTPVFIGLDAGTPDKPNVINLGANTSILLPPNCEAKFLQVGSEGFGSLEKLMDRKEAQMAAVGARMLAPEKKAVEAADTVGMRHAGENSVLAAIAGEVGRVIQTALQFAATWAGKASEKFKFELNKDFIPAAMTAQELTALVAAWQAGGISDLSFFEKLQAGGILKQTLTFEEEQDRKESSTPALSGAGNADSE